jgi:hypothetical protein
MGSVEMEEKAMERRVVDDDERAVACKHQLSKLSS